MNILFYIGYVLEKLTVTSINRIIFTNYQLVDIFHWGKKVSFYGAL